MLIVAAEVGVEEGAVESVRDALLAMETETRKEPGCLTYAFSVDINDPGTLRIIERWESMEALETHFKTPHMAAFGAAIAKIKPTSMNLKVYEVAREVALPS
ncbi:MAG: antibiotic biosynthesis monooxygenase [Deltaproteobacteria bacterium]|nr:antibiotic biosynthesis monooxygenase [Deltaproteobacteria bacterium]MBW2388274.1 antibiotic biosynthesis monooxygenase [Deltaproteobacteria bacterium]MBW2725245.1 antibiotic biosynthesis monooxygenase [Deltaproteobacteria bacterium]